MITDFWGFLPRPKISTSSPFFTMPCSTRPVHTVPRPEMENTSSTASRKGLSVSRSGVGMYSSTVSMSSRILSTHLSSPGRFGCNPNPERSSNSQQYTQYNPLQKRDCRRTLSWYSLPWPWTLLGAGVLLHLLQGLERAACRRAGLSAGSKPGCQGSCYLKAQNSPE